MQLTFKQLRNVALLMLMSGCANDPGIQYGRQYSTNSIVKRPQLVLPKKTYPRTTQPVAPMVEAAPTYIPPEDYAENTFTGDFTNSSGVQAFIQQMVDKHGFSEPYLQGLFSQAQRLESVIRLEMGDGHTIGPPKPHLGSWTRYRKNFLTEEHIRNGVEFWRANANILQKASATYGVDPEYIVGIIGVETFFGRNIGKTRVFDALATLAFETPRRSRYFRSELENFLLMTREEGYEPRELVGSWAGAMGLGQFMPSSFRRLAIDFDRNGRRDLWQPYDAIGSVAHYFSRNGWQYNSPVADQIDSPQGASVIDLSTYEGDEYWQTYHNFKVIKRYNNSKKYAMAVHQLAQAIKQRL